MLRECTWNMEMGLFLSISYLVLLTVTFTSHFYYWHTKTFLPVLSSYKHLAILNNSASSKTLINVTFLQAEQYLGSQEFRCHLVNSLYHGKLAKYFCPYKVVKREKLYIYSYPVTL